MVSPTSIVTSLLSPPRARTLPTSGSEPLYDPSRYTKAGMCRRHNCLAYALDVAHPTKSMFLQIQSDLGGSDDVLRLSAGMHRKPLKTRQCLLTELFFHRRYPATYRVPAEKACKRGFAKIAILNSAPRKSRGRPINYDFHFVRQNANGSWSHKRGGTEITRLNAKQQRIFDPRDASFDYGRLKYKPCSFFCVRAKGKRHTPSRRTVAQRAAS